LLRFLVLLGVKNSRCFAIISTVRISKKEQIQKASGVHLGRVVSQPGFICILLVLLTGWLFFPTIHNNFVNYDDPEYITANVHVQSGLTWDTVRWAFAGVEEAAFWAPVTMLSHALVWQVVGSKPWGHHLANVVLHAVNTGLVFLVLRRLTGATWRSLFVAALFGVHPLRVESVAWVTERKDVLSASFWMLSLWTYARFVEESKAQKATSMVFYGGALGFYALGLMSKPMLVTVPILLLLLDYWPLRRNAECGQGREVSIRGRNWTWLVAEKAPFFVLAAAASAVTFIFQNRGGAVATLAGVPLVARVENVPVSYCRYLGKLFWPMDLAVFYPHPGHWPMGTVFASSLLLTGVSIAAITMRRQHPYVFVGWFWFVVALLPVIELVQTGLQSMADRFVYVPLIGILLVLTWGTCELTRQWRYQKGFLSSAAAAAILICIPLTRQQIGYWKDSETLFLHATVVTENNYLAENNLGVALADKGRWDEAIKHYQKGLGMEPALEIAPNYAEAHNNLGLALIQKGQMDDAIAHYRRALELKPSFAAAMDNLGVALAKRGQVEEATALFQKALEIRPEFAEAHYDLGLALLQRGQPQQAVAHFRRAQEIRPGYAEAHNNLGSVLAQMGETEEAIAQFRRTLEIRPDFAEAHNNLGWVLLQRGRVEESITHLQRALECRPDYAEAHNSLGIALLREGRVDEAAGHFQKALEINPGYLEAQHNLGAVLLRKELVDQAIVCFEKVVQIRPDYAEAHYNLGVAFLRKGQVEQAMIHLQKALEIRPQFAEAEYSLGNALVRKGDAVEAVACLEKALESRPDFTEAQNNLAWVLATWPAAAVRNGARAVQLAEQADHLSGGKNPAFKGTLAAAYAEAGRFSEAVATAQRALRLAKAQTNDTLIEALQPQIGLYQAGSPVRDPAQPNSSFPAPR
jgi:tetratricopeptide (TPR) repeat protein